ncbi:MULTISPECIES: inorganic diphosphatase [Jeongeupia]|uniref:Inorganic pyrophosphatase n=2 Tax=Jeongeupia TaxID=885864 RepID=A0ABS2BNE0_9NEIS|nr:MULTISPECIES: inorganic diphosphatase [Jeongeupia]AOY00021.1 inorganic pyrophosphatase [Jeongeupia sp. USM3]MBM3116945.1 inorganic diphosphatase [Jeongeupia naejangsanensis]GHD68419.1 inorganic pyrophosphatase [Jeongeupia chitinilytica]
MDISKIPAGKDLPNDFNVIIEIPANAPPVKYEFDKEAGCIIVDRFVGTSMSYPMNYGFVPHTLSLDGDPVDVLVHTPFPLSPGMVIKCRAIGVLGMEDEAGQDAKVIAVPVEKVCAMYAHIQKLEDLPELLLAQVKHYFEHYKDLEKGKWVKVTGWGDKAAAQAEIVTSFERAQKG